MVFVLSSLISLYINVNCRLYVWKVQWSHHHFQFKLATRPRFSEQEAMLLWSSWLLLPFPSRTRDWRKHRTFTDLWSKVNLLKANQAPGFARLRSLPHSPLSLAILRQENLHWKHWGNTVHSQREPITFTRHGQYWVVLMFGSLRTAELISHQHRA